MTTHLDLPASRPLTNDIPYPLTPTSSPFAHLKFTPRQEAVLKSMLQGHPNKVIARQVGIAEGTVKVHLWAIYQMLGVHSRSQAIYKAHKFQLIDAILSATHSGT